MAVLIATTVTVRTVTATVTAAVRTATVTTATVTATVTAISLASNCLKWFGGGGWAIGRNQVVGELIITDKCMYVCTDEWLAGWLDG
jgi:hypothetical protein